MAQEVTNFSGNKVASLLWSLLERLKVQTAGLGVDAKACGRMEDASTSSQRSLGWPLSLLSSQENPPELSENLELSDLQDLKKTLQSAWCS